MSSRGTSRASSAFGLYIELVEHFVEGMVHVSTMADDYYRFVEARTCCAARRRAGVSARRQVKVQVIRVDMERRQIDLGLVEILERVRKGERGARRSDARSKQDPRRRKQRPGRRERKKRR